MTKEKKTNLNKLMKILNKRIPEGKNLDYYIPDLWNCFGYNSEETRSFENGELKVNPYKFYHDCIQQYILPKATNAFDYTRSVHQNTNLKDEGYGYIGGDWIKKSSVYSMQIRTSTSWDHNHSGILEDLNESNMKETGTFVKTLALLPLLKKMGIDTIYMLPISTHSTRLKKGDMGSPYAIKNFFEIDEELNDPMTGNSLTVEEEFSAFVEACHILYIKVIIDIIPRTAARDNDLVISNPEWFYWAKTNEILWYTSPFVDGIKENSKPSVDELEKIYSSHEVRHHIEKFSNAPNLVNPKIWDTVVKAYEMDKEVDFINLIEREFGLTVAPAFSDCINDPQPTWNDITFFRLYLDHPNESQRFLGSEEKPPYILFDVIKANIFKGNVINEDLWNTLSSIIPQFQKKFGIDGARIDMGHSLPSELVQRILKIPRESDPEFCFIAEELYPIGAKISRNMGYNMIIGNGFMMEPRNIEHKTHEFMYNSVALKTATYACAETHDTPRIAARDGGRVLAKALATLNMFMPNGVPFINSGQEFYETQPMNTGLDCRDNEMYMLPENDPFFGKLALFDKFALHWCNYGRWELPDILEAVSKIRETFIDSIIDLDNYIPLGFDNLSTPAIGFSYIINDRRWKTHDNVLMIIGSTDTYWPIDCTVYLGNLRNASGNSSRKVNLMYSSIEHNRDIYDFDDDFNLKLHLAPGEVKILFL